jgi:hypothetical protein
MIVFSCMVLSYVFDEKRVDCQREGKVRSDNLRYFADDGKTPVVTTKADDQS